MDRQLPPRALLSSPGPAAWGKGARLSATTRLPNGPPTTEEPGTTKGRMKEKLGQTDKLLKNQTNFQSWLGLRGSRGLGSPH